MTTGERGEQRTAEFLERKGYTILTRNYHSRYGEIDIICKNGRYLAFVEVKTRMGDAPGAPREAVTFSKQKKIIRTAQHWLIQHPTRLQPRFDVAEVLVYRERGVCRIQYIPNAFEVK